MKIISNLANYNNAIVTIAIGKKYYDSWEHYALPLWKQYCEKYNLSLFVIDQELISKEDEKWKKPTWQKGLMGNAIRREFPHVNNICYLDSDILINYTAPNIFDFHEESKVSLVSKRNNLPYNYESVLRRIAFLRHNYINNKYPLDSALFMPLDKVYRYHGLSTQNDEACMGLIMFNIEEYSDLFEEWFMKYPKDVNSITGGGDQTHYNYEILNHGKVNWLDYRFQALWVYEMAWKYSFLFDYGSNNNELIKECIEASLFTNYFLHFAGSWNETNMWMIDGILQGQHQQSKFERFNEYMETSVTGNPVGQIKLDSGLVNELEERLILK